MTSRRIFFGFTFLFSLSQVTFAKNISILAGGGCEKPGPEKTGNMFESNFKLLNRGYSSVGWEMKNLYDGNEWQKPVPGATNFTKELLIGALSANEGDQIILTILTHGGPSTALPGSPISRGGITHSHEICLGDGTMMPISEIKTTIEALVKKGVKVAVIDESCYSGGSVTELMDTGACVMSGAAQINVQWGDSMVSRTINQFMLAGENKFLEASENGSGAGYYKYLMGNKIDLNADQNVSLAEIIREFRLNGGAGKNSPQANTCKLPQRFQEIMDFISLLAAQVGVGSKEQQSCAVNETVTSMEALLSAIVKPERDKIRADQIAMGSPEGSFEEIISLIQQDIQKLKKLENEGEIYVNAVSRDLGRLRTPSVRGIITQFQKKVGEEMDQLRKHLLPFMDLACEMNPNPTGLNACESFQVAKLQPVPEKFQIPKSGNLNERKKKYMNKNPLRKIGQVFKNIFKRKKPKEKE